LLGGRDDADPPVAGVLPPRVALPDDLLLLGRARCPELRPILARTEALRLEGSAPALLPQAHRHPVRLRLHHQSESAHVFIGVVVLVHAVRVHDREVVLLPVVSDAVVDLVALALEDVEARLVLVAVAVIGATREKLDEMHLQRLRQEGIVARAQHPRGPRLVGVARVADARVVDDGACTAAELPAAIAHGYTRVTGKPMAAIVHDVVGLLHSSMAIYYAHIDRVPVLVLGATGPLDRSKRRPYIDWIHSALVQGNAVRDFVKWDDQPASVADFAPSFARGYRIATTEPAGPIYLCYDAGLQEDELERPVSVKAEVEAALPTAPQADPAALAEASERIAKAERPVIVAEYAGRHAEGFREVVVLAELIGAPVIDLQARLNIATR